MNFVIKTMTLELLSLLELHCRLRLSFVTLNATLLFSCSTEAIYGSKQRTTASGVVFRYIAQKKESLERPAFITLKAVLRLEKLDLVIFKALDDAPLRVFANYF